jgi:CHAT domain-containing protein/predicted negative regulator of RcsB-dependent stress response
MVLQGIRRRLQSSAIQAPFKTWLIDPHLRRVIQLRDRRRCVRFLWGVVTCWLVVCPGWLMPQMMGIASAHDRNSSMQTRSMATPIAVPIAAPITQTVTAQPQIDPLALDPFSLTQLTHDPPSTPAPSSVSYLSDLERSGRDALAHDHYIQAQRDFAAAIVNYEQAQHWAEAAGSAYMLSRTYVEMGDMAAATIALDRGLTLIDKIADPPFALSAQLHAQQGRLQHANGRTEEAIASLETALSLYQQIDDPLGTIATQIDLATFYHELGLYQRARQQLTVVQDDLDRIDNVELQTLHLIHLADVELAIGTRDTAENLWEQALKQARRAHLGDACSTILSRLARLAHERGDLNTAIQRYREAAAITSTPIPAIAAELGAIDSEIDRKIETVSHSPSPDSPTSWEARETNRLEVTNLATVVDLGDPSSGTSPALDRTAIDLPADQAIETALRLLFDRINALPEDQAKAQLQVYLSGRVRIWYDHLHRWAIAPRNLAEGLRTSLIDRRNVGDLRIQTQILSELGQLYGDLGDVRSAIGLTQNAIALANQAHTMGVAAMLHHHLGRLLVQANQPTEAIESYRQAILHFRSVRQEYTASSDSNIQLSFQNTVEPVYREAIGLLLQPEASQDAIREARDLLEALQIAEISNYFRANCLISRSIEVGKIDPQAAILYPIVLPDRLEILLSLPDNTMQRHTVRQPQAMTLAAAAAARSSMSRSRGLEEQQEAMQRLDRWMITPFAAHLDHAGIQTLVFVLDVPFRTIPMAALFDGQRYAIERYNIAIAPSLQLLETTSQERASSSVFLGALEAARQGFRSLPGVRDEVQAIADYMPSELRINEQFTLEALKDVLRYTSNPIIHLATHGQFGSTPDSTFVLAWDGKLNLTDFREELLSRDEVRHGAIDLLVLSACQTAIGDKLAILGMAGFAVQSGARATIASLWGVNDDATARQMTFLYEALAQPDISKAEALRQAQLQTIALGGDYAKPFYWAPFVLIGNWL